MLVVCYDRDVCLYICLCVYVCVCLCLFVCVIVHSFPLGCQTLSDFFNPKKLFSLNKNIPKFVGSPPG